MDRSTPLSSNSTSLPFSPVGGGEGQGGAHVPKAKGQGPRLCNTEGKTNRQTDRHAIRAL